MNAPPARGLRAIIAYKTVKAALQLGLAVLLGALLPFGLAHEVAKITSALHAHVTHGWALNLADLLARHSSTRSIELSLIALGLDGALTALEAWALRRGNWWGPWLVVVATSALLPFELYEFWRVPRFSRALVFSLNLAIVIYLARRATRERADARRTAP
jgi:uncharacterized membrane protein (DUF2068 family)